MKLEDTSLKLDISDEDEVSSLFDYVKRDFSCLDILVNNAGVLDDSTLKKLKSEQFDNVIDVNLRGTYLCGKAASDIMIEQDERCHSQRRICGST